jgi:hypothetical protein
VFFEHIAIHRPRCCSREELTLWELIPTLKT